MKISTLIVDDEPLARERLRKLLERESDIEVLEECANGNDAVQAVRRLRPDLVFLDIHMPELDGFAVIEALHGSVPPAVIFVTAYDKFALKAFEVHALDYLLKPFDRARFQKALDHARAQLKRNDRADLHARLDLLMAELKNDQHLSEDAKFLERIAVKTEGRVLLFKIQEIDWIEAADNYVNLHLNGQSHLHRETLSALELKLPPEKFLRISRSVIVNVERIKELQPLFHGDYVVILQSGAKLTLSRNYREKLNAILGK